MTGHPQIGQNLGLMHFFKPLDRLELNHDRGAYVACLFFSFLFYRSFTRFCMMYSRRVGVFLPM